MNYCSILLVIFLLSASFAYAQNCTQANHLTLEKSKHTLTLWCGREEMNHYTVSLGSHPIGKKKNSKDGKTPEGHYFIVRHNPHSHFYKSLKISYPNAQDIADAQKMHADPGGDIMIHGLPNGLGYIGKLQQVYDWTAGCIAVSNSQMDEIYSRVPDGTPIDITP